MPLSVILSVPWPSIQPLDRAFDRYVLNVPLLLLSPARTPIWRLPSPSGRCASATSMRRKLPCPTASSPGPADTRGMGRGAAVAVARGGGAGGPDGRRFDHS